MAHRKHSKLGGKRDMFELRERGDKVPAGVGWLGQLQLQPAATHKSKQPLYQPIATIHGAKYIVLLVITSFII